MGVDSGTTSSVSGFLRKQRSGTVLAVFIRHCFVVFGMENMLFCNVSYLHS